MHLERNHSRCSLLSFISNKVITADKIYLFWWNSLVREKHFNCLPKTFLICFLVYIQWGEILLFSFPHKWYTFIYQLVKQVPVFIISESNFPIFLGYCSIYKSTNLQRETPENLPKISNLYILVNFITYLPALVTWDIIINNFCSLY